MKLLKNITLNLILGLNVFILFFLLFESKIVIPTPLQVLGRMHPLLLHFPIVLLLLALVFELFNRHLSDQVPGERGATAVREDQIPKDENSRGNKILPKAVQAAAQADNAAATGGAAANKAVGLLLYAGALSAAVTVVFGLILSKEEGYGGSTMSWHKWTGVAITFLSALLLWYQQGKKVHTGLLRIGMAVSCLILIIAGHLGAALTHGENFMLQPVLGNEKPTVDLARAVVYPDLIMPILDDKCLSCHNANKAKGELILTDSATFLTGGEHGALLPPPNDTARGLLIERLLLDLEHEHHMPPKGKPQLSPEELALIQAWVKSGGSFSAPLATLPPDDTIHLLAKAVYGAPEEEEVFDFPAASESKIAELNNDYRVIAPLAEGSPALDVSLFNKTVFTDNSISDLKAIGEQIVYLNVSGMPLEPKHFKLISEFNNLRQLNLNYTPVNDEDLKQLSRLPHLHSIMLTGTKVSPAGIDAIAKMDKLRHIYAWNTEISPGQVNKWTNSNPQLSIETGYYADDSTLLALNPPEILPEKTYFNDSVHVELKHTIKGTELRYTLDGSRPDSQNAPVYKEPLIITRDTVIKVRAFKKGWTGSAVTEANFRKTRLKPDSSYLVNNAEKPYEGRGTYTLFDLTNGVDYRDGKWLGYRKNPLEAILRFDEAVEISKVTVSCLALGFRGVVPPGSMEVWGGDSPEKMEKLGEDGLEEPASKGSGGHLFYDCVLQKKPVRYIKIIVDQAADAPENSYILIDELLLN